jgi:hypothetical protein
MRRQIRISLTVLIAILALSAVASTVASAAKFNAKG